MRYKPLDRIGKMFNHRDSGETYQAVDDCEIYEKYLSGYRWVAGIIYTHCKGDKTKFCMTRKQFDKEFTLKY